MSWSSVKDNPIWIIAIVVVATGGVVWAVDGAIRVNPRDEQITALKEKLSQEQAKNADPSKPPPAAVLKDPGHNLPFSVYAPSDRRDQGNWLNALVSQLTEEGESEREKYKDYLLPWIEFSPFQGAYKFKLRISSSSRIETTGLFAFRVHPTEKGAEYQQLQVTYEERHRIISVPETALGDWVVLLLRLSSEQPNLLPKLSDLNDSQDFTLKVLPL